MFYEFYIFYKENKDAYNIFGNFLIYSYMSQSQSQSQSSTLEWLNLPIDVIEKQFDNLSLGDIKTLTTITNVRLYNTILNYIKHNISARKYDYDDLLEIYKFGGKFIDLVPINFSDKYVEYVYFTNDNDK